MIHIRRSTTDVEHCYQIRIRQLLLKHDTPTYRRGKRKLEEKRRQ
jgi:hypothetical protein